MPDHAAAVKAGGAEDVRVALPDRIGDTGPAVVEAHYTFPSRKAFDTYLQVHAPALRADNLKNFPPETGIKMERQIAEIAAVI